MAVKDVVLDSVSNAKSGVGGLGDAGGGLDANTVAAWQSAYAPAAQPGPVSGSAIEGSSQLQGFGGKDITGMQQTVGPQEGVQPVSQALFDPAMNSQSHKAMTPGDRILNGLKTTSDNLTERLESVAKLVSENGGDMSLSTALHVQVEVTKFGIEAELTSKIISKSTQDLDQLTRMQ